METNDGARDHDDAAEGAGDTPRRPEAGRKKTRFRRGKREPDGEQVTSPQAAGFPRGTSRAGAEDLPPGAGPAQPVGDASPVRVTRFSVPLGPRARPRAPEESGHFLPPASAESFRRVVGAAPSSPGAVGPDKARHVAIVSSRDVSARAIGREEPTCDTRPRRSGARSIEVRIEYDPRKHVLHQPEVVQFVIQRHELETMACTGGLRAHIERRLRPGRYAACWIGDDGCEFDREVFEVPDLLKQRQQAWREKRVADRRAERERERERERQRIDGWIRDHTAMALDACRRLDPLVDVHGVLSTARAALWANAHDLSRQDAWVVQRFLSGVLGRAMVWSAWRRP